MNYSFTLASASKPRAKILTDLGLDFIIKPSSYDESACGEHNPAERAKILALSKAQAVHSTQVDRYTIGCDTTVESATGELFEKPKNKIEASTMLQAYSNSYCSVHTGIAVITPNGLVQNDVHTSRIYFSAINAEDIEVLLKDDDWKYCAGALTVEAGDGFFIRIIEGEVTSIMGFPVYLFGNICKKIGIKIADLL